MIIATTRHQQRFFPDLDQRQERRTALRLQPQQNAGGFKDRCLSLPIVANEEIEPVLQR
jgi:hypothetical protein